MEGAARLAQGGSMKKKWWVNGNSVIPVYQLSQLRHYVWRGKNGVLRILRIGDFKQAIVVDTERQALMIAFIAYLKACGINTEAAEIILEYDGALDQWEAFIHPSHVPMRLAA